MRGRALPVKVDVCIITYRRPRGLHRLLGSFQRLRFEDPAPELRVVVVDNDAEGSARPVCEDAGTWLDLPLCYLLEKRRGIPQARNAAIAASLGHSDFLAFIDDDEVPAPEWLAELLRVQAGRDADAVAGPCEPLFEEKPPRWIERGRFFERSRFTTGTRIDYAYTHNVLVRTAALATMPSLFDGRLALCGGSDLEFFRRFARSGKRIVWADSARVFEWVPASRANLRWLLVRAIRTGTSTAFIERRDREAPVSAVRLAAHGAWCVAKGSALLVLGCLRGRAACVRALRLVVYGAGRIGGLLGLRVEEYRTTHGV